MPEPSAFLQCAAGLRSRRSSNTVQQLQDIADPIDESNEVKNAFTSRQQAWKQRSRLFHHVNLETAERGRLSAPIPRIAVGEPVGYKFIPGDNWFPFASPNAWWRKRAGFVEHHVWVTPYSEEENYAAGDFPNQSQGGDGLIKWTAANRPIANQDVVFWYTFGHTHIPRPKTIRSCQRPTLDSCSSQTAFSIRIRPTMCRPPYP